MFCPKCGKEIPDNTVCPCEQQPQQQFQYQQPYMPPLQNQRRNIILCLILGTITCGIYNLYWRYVMSKEINAKLGREVISPTSVILMYFCFPITYLHFFEMDKALLELYKKLDKQYISSFALWVVTSILGGVGGIIELIQVQSLLNDAADGV